LRRPGNLAAVIGGLLCLFSSAALAQGARPRAAVGDDDEPPSTKAEMGAMDRVGVDLALHIGYSLPIGDLVQGVQISDGLSGAVPFGVELAVRANKNVALGLGFEVAAATTKNCDPGFNCSGTGYRLNVETIFTSRAGMAVDPWLALGAGYEWLELSESGTSAVELTGWDYANIEVGGEIRGEQCGLSPFVGVSLGAYTSGSVGGTPGDVANPSLHAWLQFGLRGVVNL
jgi:hypothetical protein